MRKMKQYGGILTLMTGVAASRYNKIKQDEYGRWCITKYQIGILEVAIINIYCPGKIQNPGVETLTSQMKRELKRRNKRINEIQEWYIKDLENIIQTLKKNEMEILFAIDFNVENKPNSLIAKMFEKTYMIDLFKKKYGNNVPNTRTPGKRTIDIVGITRRLIDFIEYCGFLPFNIGHQSDHRAIWLDIKTSKTIKNIPKNYQMRKIVSTNTKIATKYATLVEKEIERMEIEQILENIENNKYKEQYEINNILENLDTLITSIMIKNKTKANKNDKNNRAPWAPKIVEKRRILKYWKIINKWGEKAPDIHQLKVINKDSNENDIKKKKPWIRNKIRQINKELKEMETNSHWIRQEYLNEKKEEYKKEKKEK